MNATVGSIEDFTSFTDSEYVNTAMLVIMLLERVILWVLKLRNRVRNNEERVKNLEDKLGKISLKR